MADLFKTPSSLELEKHQQLLASSGGGAAGVSSEKAYSNTQQNTSPGTTSSSNPTSLTLSSLTSFYWMLQDPVDEIKHETMRNKSIGELPITNKLIDVYNRYTRRF